MLSLAIVCCFAFCAGLIDAIVGGGGLIDLITKTQQNHNQQSAAGGIFQKLLDRDGDGEIMDDLLSMGSQSLLGGLFKK